MALVVLRNWLGYGGVALISGWLLGSAFGWVMPLAAYWLIRFYGLTADMGGVVWAWPHRPALDSLALGQAVGWLAAGMALVAWRATMRRSAPVGESR